MNYAHRLSFPAATLACAALGIFAALRATPPLTIEVHLSTDLSGQVRPYEPFPVACKLTSLSESPCEAQVFPIVEHLVQGAWVSSPPTFSLPSQPIAIAANASSVAHVFLQAGTWAPGSYRFIAHCKVTTDTDSDCIESTHYAFTVATHAGNSSFFTTASGVQLLDSLHSTMNTITYVVDKLDDPSTVDDDPLDDDALAAIVAAHPELSERILTQIRVHVASAELLRRDYNATLACLPAGLISAYQGAFGGLGVQAEFQRITAGWRLSSTQTAFDQWTLEYDTVRTTFPIGADLYDLGGPPRLVRDLLPQ